ncbi:L-serine ammonia-lyase, iron-sulfur-dependent, subunit alpha [Candidatus Bipolaricaulota bacterium]|nr:L-serine ammonia-lyase, iron-sulfur-dependent, subunit alpha [Candidatus Bipolaricaulota bacterium]
MPAGQRGNCAVSLRGARDPVDHGCARVHGPEHRLGDRVLRDDAVHAPAVGPGGSRLCVGDVHGRVVTAPTCGAAGVVPAVLRVLQETLHLPDERIHQALLVAGLIGLAMAANASIAGAEVGCQGEVGTASAMAAAAACYLLGGDAEAQVDRAAETALEHYLGLTCDPVYGLVQIPCIERNAAAAVAALHAASLAVLCRGEDRISFDTAVAALAEIGRDMSPKAPGVRS